MAKGDFILVNRSLLKWEWYSDLPVRVLFQHLMLTVNWAPGRFKGVNIAPGQVPTSVQAMAAGSGLTVQQTKTALSKLKSTGEVTCQATSHFTVVTLVNWAKWQNDQPTKQPQSNQRATSNQPSSNHGATTIEEGKKENKEIREEGKVERAALVWPSWSSDRFREVWAKWKAYKAERKEGYKPIGEQMALTAIAKEFSFESEAIEATEHSMGKGWAGVYRQKQERGTLRPTAPQPEVKFKAGY